MDLKERKRIYNKGFSLAMELFDNAKLNSRDDMAKLLNIYVNDEEIMIKHYEGMLSLSNAEWYAMIGRLWESEEVPNQWYDSWFHYFKPSMFEGKLIRDTDMDLVMSNDELKVWNELDDEFKVYRGITYLEDSRERERHWEAMLSDEDTYENRIEEESMSWTLSEHHAHLYSKKISYFTEEEKQFHSWRYDVISLWVSKDVPYPTRAEDKAKAVAFKNSNKDSEIIVYNCHDNKNTRYRLPTEELRDRNENYNPITSLEAQKKVGDFIALEDGYDVIEDFHNKREEDNG